VIWSGDWWCWRRLWLDASESESCQLKFFFLHVQALPELYFFWKLRGTSAVMDFQNKQLIFRIINIGFYFQMFETIDSRCTLPCQSQISPSSGVPRGRSGWRCRTAQPGDGVLQLDAPQIPFLAWSFKPVILIYTVFIFLFNMLYTVITTLLNWVFLIKCHSVLLKLTSRPSLRTSSVSPLATLVWLCAWHLWAHFQVVPANHKEIFILHHVCLAAWLPAGTL
jgi:hypothetical protein